MRILSKIIAVVSGRIGGAMRKRIALGICFILTVLTFAGCKELPVNENLESTPTTVSEGSENVENTETKENEANEEIKVDKWTPEEGAALRFRTNDKEFGEAAAVLFKEKYGVAVTVEQGGAYDFTKGVLEGVSGQGPDVFMSPHDKTLEGIQAGIFLEIDSEIVDNLKTEISDVAMKTVTVDNKVFGIPISIETYVMFYNKTLVTGEPVSSFEQLKEEALTFNNQNENKFIYLSDVTTGSPIYPMLSTYGFRLFGEDGTDDNNPGFDTPEFEKGLEVLADYHSIMPIPSGDLANPDFFTTQFIEGRTAYILGGPWNVKAFREAGIDFGVTKIVTYDGNQQKPFAFVQNAHVSAYSKYPIAAQLFAEFLVSKECAELLYTKAFKITTRADSETIEGLKDDADLVAITKAFEESIPMPSAKRISYYWSISGNIGPAVFDQKLTPAEGAKKAQEDWNAFLLTE